MARRPHWGPACAALLLTAACRFQSAKLDLHDGTTTAGRGDPAFVGDARADGDAVTPQDDGPSDGGSTGDTGQTGDVSAGGDPYASTCATGAAETTVSMAEGPAGASTCSDSLDNDGDSLTDASDPSCFPSQFWVGTLVWGGGNPIGIAPRGDGGIYVGGPCDTMTASKGCVAQLDAAGQLVDQTGIRLSDAMAFTSVDALASLAGGGFAVVAGAHLAVFSSDGVMSFSRRYRRTDVDRGVWLQAVTTTADGDIVIAGTYEGGGVRRRNLPWIARVEGTSGAIVWQQGRGTLSNYDHSIAGVTRLPAGDLVAVGALGGSSYSQLFAVRVASATGAILWEAVETQNVERHNAVGVATFANGDLVVGSRGTVFRLTPGGSLRWSVDFSGLGIIVSDVAVTPLQQILVTGSSSGPTGFLGILADNGDCSGVQLSMSATTALTAAVALADGDIAVTGVGVAARLNPEDSVTACGELATVSEAIARTSMTWTPSDPGRWLLPPVESVDGTLLTWSPAVVWTSVCP